MKIKIVHYSITDELKNQKLKLFLFIYRKVLINIFQSPVMKILVFLLFSYTLLLALNLLPIIYKNKLSILPDIFFIFVLLLPIIISLEEFFHSIVVLAKNRPEYLKNLAIANLVNKKGTKLLTVAMAMHFKGKFTKLDFIHICSRYYGNICFALLIIPLARCCFYSTDSRSPQSPNTGMYARPFYNTLPIKTGQALYNLSSLS